MRQHQIIHIKYSILDAIDGGNDKLAQKLWRQIAPEASKTEICAYIREQKQILAHKRGELPTETDNWTARRSACNTKAIIAKITSIDLLRELETKRENELLTKRNFCMKYNIDEAFYINRTTKPRAMRKENIERLRKVLAAK